MGREERERAPRGPDNGTLDLRVAGARLGGRYFVGRVVALPTHRIAAAILGIAWLANAPVALALAPTAQAPSFSPAEVSAGPLLFFVRPQDASGRPSTDGFMGRIEVGYVFDTALDCGPEEVWRGDSPPPRPIARLDRSRVLTDDWNHLRVVDLDTGRATWLRYPLLRSQFVEFDGEHVFFAEELQAGSDRDSIRSIQRLFVWSARASSTAERLGTLEIEKLLSVRDDGFWCITSGEHRELVRIARDGTATTITEFHPKWLANASELTFSPDGAFAALTSTRSDGHRWLDRELAVLDVGRRSVIAYRGRLQTDFGFSYPLPLYVEWVDPHRLFVLANPRSFVVDARTGEDSTDPYELPSDAEASDDIRRWRRGGFEFDDLWDGAPNSTIRFAGDVSPLELPGAISRSAAVSPDGRWAAYDLQRDGRRVLRLADSERRSLTDLLPGWTYDHAWLPAAR